MSAREPGFDAVSSQSSLLLQTMPSLERRNDAAYGRRVWRKADSGEDNNHWHGSDTLKLFI